MASSPWTSSAAIKSDFFLNSSSTWLFPSLLEIIISMHFCLPFKIKVLENKKCVIFSFLSLKIINEWMKFKYGFMDAVVGPLKASLFLCLPTIFPDACQPRLSPESWGQPLPCFKASLTFVGYPNAMTGQQGSGNGTLLPWNCEVETPLRYNLNSFLAVCLHLHN